MRKEFLDALLGNRKHKMERMLHCNTRYCKAILFVVFVFVFLGDCSAQSWKLLQNKSEHYFGAGDYKLSADYANKAISAISPINNKNRDKYVVSINQLGLINYLQNEHQKALSLFREVDSIQRIMTLDTIKLNTAYIRNYANVCERVGNYKKALSLNLEALNLDKIVLGNDPPNYIQKLNVIGQIYTILGLYDSAIKTYSEAIDKGKKNFRKNDIDYGISVNSLGRLYHYLGRDEEALPLCNQALDIFRRSLGEDHLYVSISLGILASLYEDMARYEKALPYRLAELDIAEKIGENDPVNYAVSLNSLGVTYYNLGLFETSMQLYLKSLEICKKENCNSYYYNAFLNNLASLYSHKKKYEQAIVIYKDIIEKTEKELGHKHPSYLIALNNLGALYYDMEDYEKSFTLLSEVVHLTKETLGANHPDYVARVANLGSAYHSLKNYPQALNYTRDALRATKNIWGEENIHYAYCLLSLASIYQDLFQYDSALFYKRFSYKVLLKNRSQYLNVLKEQSQQEYAKSEAIVDDASLSVFYRYLLKDISVALDAYNLELFKKGFILSNVIDKLNIILSSGDSSLIGVYDQYLLLRGIIAKQYSLPIAKRRTDIAEVESKADKLEVELSEKTEAFKEAIDERSIKWEQVKQQLKVGEVAIEFSSFQYRDKKWTDSVFYCAYLVRYNDTLPQLIYLFEQRQLDSLLGKMDYTICGGDGECLAGKINHFHDWNGNGQRLYQLIWSKIEPYLKGVNTVYYSPSGKLHKINLGALPVSEQAVLAEKYKLVQLNSTRSIALPSFKPIYVTDTTSVALFGGISYDTDSTTLKNAVAAYHANATSDPWLFASRGFETDSSQRGGSWRYLPGTLDEVRSIKPMFSRSNIYTGLEATEEAFKTLPGKSSPDILHLATHGFFFKEQNTRDREGKINTFQSSNDPLIRSGLMLAGGNIKWSGGELPQYMEDGILTAKEVAAMNLYNTKLAVLSACETGLGDVKGSEGVYGLQRAFKAAGVKYLLMSLWSVPDRATAAFMKSFYVELKNGKDIQTAFDNTQKHMRQQYAEPFYWAGFVLVR